MAYEFDLDAFEADLEKTIANGRAAFEGEYKDELNDLAGLSREEIDKITPDDVTDLQKYDELISVVKEASRNNLKQAELKRQIEKLGDVAVIIAKKIPKLAAIL